MKKFLLVLFSVLVFSGIGFSATSSSGAVVTAPDTGLSGDNFHFNTFTHTYTAVTNVVKGVIVGEFPTGWPLDSMTMSGTADEAKKYFTWTFAGKNYFGVTVTAANEATVIFSQSVTIPAAATYAFKWYQADYDLNTYNAVALAANTTVTVSDSNNCVTWSVVPTVVIQTTDVSKIVYTGAFTGAVSGGQLIFNLDDGSGNLLGIFAKTTPSPLTWVAQAITGVKNNGICVNARAGVFSGSPTCNATQCIVPIGTAAAAETFEVIYGKPTATPDIGPQGSSYTNGLRIRFRSNAFFPAATVTPQVQPTAFYNPKGKEGFLVLVPTPTVVITVVSQEDNSQVITLYGPAGSDKKVYSSGGTLQKTGDKGSSTAYIRTEPLKVGSYAISYLMGWYDWDNDGTYRTNTVTASVNVPPLESDIKNALISGRAVSEYYTTVFSGTATHITKYAQAQYFYKVDSIGTTDTVHLARVVDGATATVNSIMVPKLALGMVGGLDNPYILPADTACRWYAAQGAPTAMYLEFLRYPLPTR